MPSKNKKTPADYHLLAKSRGFRWLGPEVPTTKTLTTWECPEGHQWQAIYNNIQQGRHCPFCPRKKTSSDFHFVAQKRNFQWLGHVVTSMDTPTKWKCTHGHEWQTTYRNILRGDNCPLCSHNKSEKSLVQSDDTLSVLVEENPFDKQKQESLDLLQQTDHLDFDIWRERNMQMTLFENNEELDTAIPEEGYDDLEDIFDEGELEVEPQSNVNIEKNDRSLSEFYRWYREGRLIVDPEWQRNYLWNTKRASKLVESFLVDIPVPVIYLAKNEEGKYEVIDGLQRLTSVFNFFNNEYYLSGLEVLREYEQKKFKELPAEAQYKLQDATLRSFELSSKTSKDLLFVIFERLNTGGVPLNRMEIRNCIYRGTLNALIKDLTQNPDFVMCANQNGLSTRMRDRELVLRFLAFYEKTYHKCTQGLGRFLNDFYKTYQNPQDNKLLEFQNIFKRTMKACVTVFGDKGFRLRSKRGDWSARMNAAVYQVISVTFAGYDLSQITRRADAIYEEYLDLLANDPEWTTCVTSQTARPQNIQYAFSVWGERLKQVIGNEEPNDDVRVFSRALKEEMFKQSSVCQICENEIKLIDDAALDHELHYWRGGKTIPDNARLVHRHCNSTRKNYET